MTPSGTNDYYIGKTGITEKGTEILYYFEATDSLGNTTTRPAGAPDEYYEYSILPFVRENDGILLVVGNDRLVLNDLNFPDNPRKIGYHHEDYWREALECMGLEYTVDYDVYDIGVPGGSDINWGPRDSLEIYQTCIWFTGHLMEYSMLENDQVSLINWLESPESRDLLISGDNLAEYLIDSEHDTLDFFQSYVGASYPPPDDPYPGTLIDPFNYDLADTVVALINGDCADSLIEGGEATLRGGCPRLRNYDKVGGAISSAAFYYRSNKPGNPLYPAGTAVHMTSSGNTWDAVYLPFSFATIEDRSDRVYLLRNILDFFGNAPADTSVGIDDDASGRVFANALYRNYPNPFNPSTVIRFSIRVPGHVSIRVFNIAGQLVRVLHDGELHAGVHELAWDGHDDNGRSVSSGVYFYSLEGAGSKLTNRMVLLE
jgi:hypothetical protein